MRRFSSPAVTIALGALLGAAAGCSYYPRAVEGVPYRDPWVALPLRGWLAEDRAEPEAMAFCRPADCSPGLVVAVLRLTGEDAATAEAVLDDPARLVRFLQRSKDRSSREDAAAKNAARTIPPKRPVRTVAAAVPLRFGTGKGFTLTLGRADGSLRPAFGAALGRRDSGGLRVVLAIGEDPNAVTAAARRAAEGHSGS
jgi:hypothetical protein